MSGKLIVRSDDLRRLREEGYDIEIVAGYLLVRDVPYVSAQRVVKRGTLVSTLVLAGDTTGPPDDHVAHFEGEYPCHADGKPMDQIRHPGLSGRRTPTAGVVIDHSFSAKPATGKYDDYYAKMTTYASVISAPAKAFDPEATAQTRPIVQPDKSDEEATFNYIDTASSRAEIDAVTHKLALGQIAIVGLGGTGSYVLDLVAKTPVKQIHLFDGDTFWQHNAFRAPGAASLDELRAKAKKVTYLKSIYSKMHRGIVDHPSHVDRGNVGDLRGMDFVFLCLDRGSPKKMIVEHLEEYGIPFVDVGMGVDVTNESLGGILTVTTSTSKQREHFRERVGFADDDGANEYDTNVQICDLNALNAALAVIKWKKLFGFYRDLDCEFYCAYTIDGNTLNNEDKRP